MADAFLSLPVADRRDMLETAAAQLGRPAVDSVIAAQPRISTDPPRR